MRIFPSQKPPKDDLSLPPQECRRPHKGPCTYSKIGAGPKLSGVTFSVQAEREGWVTVVNCVAVLKACHVDTEPLALTGRPVSRHLRKLNFYLITDL